MNDFKPRLAGLKNSIFWAFAYLLFFMACGEGPPSEIPVVDRRFRTTPPSRIYFKNIRSIAYEWKQDQQSRTEYYLLRKIAENAPRPILYPTIADVWMKDQAHLLLKSDQYQELPTPIEVFWQAPDTSGVYHLDSLTLEQQYQLGLSIYKSIRQAHQLEIRFPGQAKASLFANPNERTLFLTSLQDYLRLTDYF